MSMLYSRESARLCQNIIGEHFGPVVERVITVLLQRGRMTVREVGRYVNMSTTGRRLPASVWSEDGQQRASGPSLTSSSRQNLPIRLVQQSLMVLIQHHCVLHSSQVHGGADLAQSSQDEYFEANVDEILARLRFGTYLALAHEWGGDEAEAVVRLLLYHGQMRAGDLMDELSGSGGQMNGVASGRESAAGRIGQLLVKMLQDSFVRPSTAVQHVSRQDRHITHENALRRSFKGVPTAKTLKEIKVRVAAMIDEEDRKEWEAQGNSLDEPRLGLKRKADTAALARDKRAKKHGGSDVAAVRHDADGESAALEIDRDVWLRVHYDRFNVRIRNNMLVSAVAQKYNATTGDIFRAMLQGDGPGPVRCEMDERSRPIALSALVHALPHGLKIQRGLDKRSILGEESSKSAHPTTTELLAEYVAILTNHDNISSSVRTTRFLAPFGNATTTSAGGTAKVPTSFTVEYVNMVHQLQLQMIRDVVVERFGPMAGRIFSILVENGKLEEKHISKIGLISMGETRDICSRLFAASLLSLQEVPKSNERNPQRTFFLWFVDVPKCKAWLHDHYCQTLIQLSRRRLFEQRRKASLLRKAERSDVKEDTDGLLTEWERKNLAALHHIQEAITVAETRVVLDTFLLGHFSL